MSDVQQSEMPATAADTPRRGRHAGKGFFRRHPIVTGLCALAVIVIVVIVAGFFWYRSAEKGGAPGRGEVITVSSGESFSAVSSELVSKQIIGSHLAFDIYVAIHGTPSVEPGEYYLVKHEPFGYVYDALGSPPNVLDLQVPAGFTVAEISERLESTGFESLGPQFQSLATSGKVRSPYQPVGSKNLDGLLATGNYEVLPVESATTLLEQMIDRFTSEARAAGLQPTSSVNGLDAYQEITVASIVEKEGVYSENLTKVSRVIYNRLARSMPLQMDSTVLYALGQDGGTVTSADLRIQSPYNTYLNTGLTPTAVCFPSQASLEAALHPADGQWLYFVLVSRDGTEAFADTYSGQLANEQLAKQRGLP